jgi:1-acyl-sn-glycerol-3-phosphate acyltransferase
MPPSYRYPARITFSILRDFILGRKRSFAADAALLKEGISRLEITGDSPRGEGPYLFLVNHYSRPGFQAWWIAITLTSASGRALHWPMTSAWTFPDPLRARLITPLTEWALARVARMYAFTLMPPMPPRDGDLQARAASVRRILHLARREKPSIGMAPEGMDSSDGRLMQPPSGAGRFISHLVGAGYALIPVGFFESGETCRLRFGAPFELPRKHPTDPETRDREAGRIVMEKIAALISFPSPGKSRERGEG